MKIIYQNVSNYLLQFLNPYLFVGYIIIIIILLTKAIIDKLSFWGIFSRLGVVSC